MGVLLEKLRKAKQEYREFLKEPCPDTGTHPMEYMDYQKRKRAAYRKSDHVSKTLKTHPFPVEQMKNTIGEVLDEKQAEKIMKTLNENKFSYSLNNFIEKKHPELIKTLSPEQHRLYRDYPKEKAKIITGWRDEGKITHEEYDAVVVSHLMMETFKTIDSDQELEAKFVDALDESLTQEQRNALVEKMDAYHDPIDLPEHEKVTYPYEARANELLGKVPLEIQADPEKKKQYEEALEFAKTHLTKSKVEVQEESKAYERDNQTIEGARDKYVKNAVLPTFQGGKYANLFEKNETSKSFLSVKEGKEEAYNELIKGGIKLSDKTKDGMRRIFHKMEEMGLEKYPYNPSGEDGDKIYGFNKLLEQKNEFIAALEEGNPEKIIQTKQAYEKTWHDTEELYRISREYFEQEKGIFPGNLDSVRTNTMPYEFTGDVRNTAYINAIFQNYVRIKEHKGATFEEFLENPIGNILQDADKKWQEKSFATKAEQAKTLEESMELMTNSGKFYGSPDEIQSAVPIFGFGRQICTPKYFETDPDVQAKNDIATITLSEDLALNVVGFSEASKFEYFSKKNVSSELEKQARYETLGNLILAKDEDRKAPSMFAGQPETDIYGIKKGNGFDAESYIQKTPVDYAGIMDRAHRVQTHAKEIGRRNSSTWLSEKNALEATRQLYTKVLLAHPEDAEKEEYKRMQQDLNRTYDRMAELDKEDLGELAQANKEVLNDMLEENRRNYLIQNDPVGELRKLEAEAVRTGDFSKYASFMVDVETQLNDLRPEVFEAYNQYQNEILAVENREFVKGNDFYRKLCHAVNQIDIENETKLSMKSEELAAKIRNGEIPVDPAFDDMKKDYNTSRILANQKLLDTEEEKLRMGTSSLCRTLGIASPRYENGASVFDYDKAQQQKEFYREGKIAENAAQRRAYLNEMQRGYSVKIGDVNPDGSFAPPHPYDITTRLEKSVAKVEEYQSSLEQLKQQAQEKLDAMDEAKLGGRSGSDEYKAMYDSLKKVTQLNGNNTPTEVEQAIANIQYTAEDYKDKIESQGIFARFRQKGKDRYEFATGLENFGKEKFSEFSEISLGNLAKNEKIDDQLMRASDNQLKYAAKLAKEELEKQAAQEKKVENAPKQAAQEKKAENAPAKEQQVAQDKVAEYLKSAKEAEKALSGMGKGIQKPEGQLWEEKMEAFVKVATAKEIERRGGLKEGETIQTVQKQLFGEKEARDTMTQMLQDYTGEQLLTLAGKQELGKTFKAYQEKKAANKEQPEKKGPEGEKKNEKQQEKPKKLEKVEPQRKRSNSVDLEGPKIE